MNPRDRSIARSRSLCEGAARDEPTPWGAREGVRPLASRRCRDTAPYGARGLTASPAEEDRSAGRGDDVLPHQVQERLGGEPLEAPRKRRAGVDGRADDPGLGVGDGDVGYELHGHGALADRAVRGNDHYAPRAIDRDEHVPLAVDLDAVGPGLGV